MSKIGKEIIVNGKHIGKVIAEPTIGFYSDAYLVLLNEEGGKYEEGWVSEITDSEEVKKACGKYGNNPKNRFLFFDKKYTYQFFEKINKVIANE